MAASQTAARVEAPGPAHSGKGGWAWHACSVRGHRTASTSGGAATDDGSVGLVVRDQRHESRGRFGCTPDVEGRVDSHCGDSSTARGGRRGGSGELSESLAATRVIDR
jgi:hypothetical protein